MANRRPRSNSLSETANGAVRRVPQQPRSRQKVANVLATAMRLFQQRGMDQVSMREIAREADLPIATVYQYFPNKQAIVQQIWENYTSAINSVLQTELESVRADPSSRRILKRVVDRVVDSIAEYYAENPAFGEIRRCVDATPDLRELNLDDTLRVAALIKTAILAVNPEARGADVANYAFIAAEAASSTISVGQQLSPARRGRLFRSLKKLLLHIFESLSDPDSAFPRLT